MKKKLIIIISVIILIIIGLVIGILLFIKEFNEDREKTLLIMDEIKTKYDEFSPLVERFSVGRTYFHTVKEDLFFLESVEENKEELMTLMKNYEILVMDVHNNSEYLQKNCDRKYSKSTVNNTCDLFKQGYEAVMNYYMTDLKIYNTFVSKYNEWLSENSSTLEPLKEQKLSLYSEYVDYDKDGSYLGGE